MKLTSLLLHRPGAPNTRPKVPPKERYFSRLNHFRMTSSRRLEKDHSGYLCSALSRHSRSPMTKKLRICRLEGSLAPFGLEYDEFMNNLAKMNVLLNRKVLSEMAVWEPRTFKTLTTLVQKQREVDGETSDRDRALRLFPTDSVLGKNYFRS